MKKEQIVEGLNVAYDLVKAEMSYELSKAGLKRLEKTKKALDEAIWIVEDGV